MPTEKPRYTITLDEEMLKKIDDFRFENRFANRTQATLELIRLGMEQLKNERDEAGRERRLMDTLAEETYKRTQECPPVDEGGRGKRQA